MADGNLQAAELRRLADCMGDFRESADEKYKYMCDDLGLDAEGPEVSIGREAFAAACHAQKHANDGVNKGKRPVEVWFEALRLELEEPGPGCIASATASWPLRILCIAAAIALLAQWLSDDGAGSGSFA